MTACLRVLCLVLPAALALPPATTATSLRCSAVNGNVNCVGSGGVSCQTINGRTVCASGDGAVVQSFGTTGGQGRLQPRDTDADADDAGPDIDDQDGPPTPPPPRRDRP